MKLKITKMGFGLAAVFCVALTATFTACGDENTTEVTEQTGMDILAKGEKLPECSKENAGEMLYVTDSAAVYYCADGKWALLNGENGSNCSAKSVKDGIEVSCDGKIVGTLENASNFTGKSCSATQDEKTKDVIITCETDDGKGVSYTIKNGESPKSCSASQNADKTETTITCPDENGKDVSYTIKNGDPGKSCSVTQNADKTETTIICPDEDGKNVSYTIKNGEPGTDCTIEEYRDVEGTDLGYKFICGDVVKGLVTSGVAGENGKNCTVDDTKGNGIVEVTCGSGKDAETVELYKAMCGTVSYDPAKAFCYGRELYECGNKPYDPRTEFCDARDKQIYKMINIKIAAKNYDEIWMAQNLNYSGTDLTSNSWCYKNDEKNCKLYGRLYTWTSAIGEEDRNCGAYRDCNREDYDVQGACPAGWHISKLAEWNALIEATGGLDESGYVLKAQSGWNSGNGIDTYGFSVVSSGFHNSFFGGDAEYTSLGDETRYWSTGVNSWPWSMDHQCPDDPEDSSDDWICDEYAIYAKTIAFGNEKKIRIREDDKRDGFSVRCLKNKN